MKPASIFIFLSVLIQLFGISTIHGQININEFPENLQLYVRDDNNNCKVVIKGGTTDSSYEFIKLVLKKNDSLNLEAISTAQNFNLSIPINAELSEYTFELLAQKNNQLVSIKKAEKVLCGDAILLYGQSNIVAGAGVDDFNATKSDKFMRNYDFKDGEDTTSTKWYTGKFPYAAVGTVGNYLMLNLMDSLKIPFLTINPSVGGAQLAFLVSRNPNNPFDKKHYYGKMLTRLKNSKVLDKLKYMAFYHGEAAAGVWYVNCNEYPALYDTLVTNLKKDLPSLNKIYEFQINIISLQNNYVERAGFVRDFQRRTKDIYPGLIEIISTVGTEPYDGVHYGKEAYIQKAGELSKLIHRDFYGKTDLDGIEHPNVQYAYYNQTKDSVTLVFQERQNVVFPQPINYGSYTRNMENFFYMTDDNQTINYNQYYVPVVAGSSENNLVKLKLTGPQNFQYLTYLPATFSDSYNVTYNGPHIKNQNNLNAFSFYCIPVLNAPLAVASLPKKPENLRTNGVNTNQINISWRDESKNEDYFVLESSTDSLAFNSIYQGTNISFIDDSLEANKKYFYRVKSCNSNGCSDYTKISIGTTFNIINYSCLSIQFKGLVKNLKSIIKGKDISSGANHVLNNLNLEAGEVVILTPGFSFKAEPEMTFKAFIKSCLQGD